MNWFIACRFYHIFMCKTQWMWKSNENKMVKSSYIVIYDVDFIELSMCILASLMLQTIFTKDFKDYFQKDFYCKH